MNHSIELHKKLYSTYKNKGLTENRRDIVFNFTNGKTDNSSELTTGEIVELINILEGKVVETDNSKKRVSKTIYKLLSLCHTYGWRKINKTGDKYVADIESLNSWLIKYGKYHKTLKEHTPYELGIVTTQFEKVVNQLLKSI